MEVNDDVNMHGEESKFLDGRGYYNMVKVAINMVTSPTQNVNTTIVAYRPF